MSQPEQWIAYVRSAYPGDPAMAFQHQEAGISAVLPPGASVTVIAEAASGSAGHRPGLERLLALVRSGSIAGVAAYDRSRIARDPGLLRELIAELKTRSVELRLATEPRTPEADRAFLEDHLELVAALSTRTPRATILRPSSHPRVPR